jgi:hypothetical protein
MHVNQSTRTLSNAGYKRQEQARVCFHIKDMSTFGFLCNKVNALEHRTTGVTTVYLKSPGIVFYLVRALHN